MEGQRTLLALFVIGCLFLLPACATTNATGEANQKDVSEEKQLGLDPSDPWESFNRKVYVFNENLDMYLLRPVAIGYDTVTPDFVQRGVGNFFSNLKEIYSVVNNALQGDVEGAGTSLMRFTLNSTLGLYGLLDIASEVGMSADQEDFGQTLAAWGVGQGNYLMLPFFGPSTTRDVFSYADSLYFDPYAELTDSVTENYSLRALELIQLRADLLSLEDSIVGDKYTFIRDVYLQRREFLVNDGVVVDDGFLDDDESVSDDDF